MERIYVKCSRVSLLPIAEILLVYKSTYMKMCLITHTNIIHKVFVFAD